MNTRTTHLLFAAALTVAVGSSFFSAPGYAHPGAINLYVDAENRLFPFQPFEPATMGLFAGIEISAQYPGFGVSFQGNGVGIGEAIELRTTLGLMYWDGQDISQTAATMTVNSPDFDSDGATIESAVPVYDITRTTTNFSGMTWGTYSGSNFWEADSLYFLNPLDAPSGIYGLAIQLDSPSHEISKPFLFPFIFDPAEEYDEVEEAVGLARLEQLLQADTNFDGLLDCQDADALVQEIVSSGNSASLDLTGDALVDGADLGVWLDLAGLHNHGGAYEVGDANLDGIVDGVDFQAWSAHKFTTGGGWCGADFDANGSTDGRDFLAWNAQKQLPSSLQNVVPEPGSPAAPIYVVSLFLAVSRRRK